LNTPAKYCWVVKLDGDELGVSAGYLRMSCCDEGSFDAYLVLEAGYFIPCQSTVAWTLT
jgi:hypothetical protein